MRQQSPPNHRGVQRRGHAQYPCERPSTVMHLSVLVTVLQLNRRYTAACCSTTVGPRRSRHPHAQVFRAWSPPRAVSGVKIMTDNPCPGLPKRCGAPYVGMPSLRSPRAQAVELMAHAQHCTELTAQMLPDVQATCVLRGCDGTTPGQALFPVLGALGPSRNSLRLGEAD
ncbi:hypothetical protein L227DRAFT_93999 [Lentinus tigrinus ALCF2SS1-6]|uniref:Uncharacterized protein n=1 Tax=Lentinus tigrinus ALCF2SS1-6 TaxID=1328759 RepID=A0A5C2SAE6_9APHY|nr:hypothetical protein L227DRAFT_93999 [Lentinus tigrinus ALCF2SS1-6]